MYDYFDKHGKKFLAVVGSLLVLVFLLPAGFGHGGGGGTRLGKLQGKRIDADDVVAAQNTLRSLDRLVFTDPRSGQTVPITQAIFPGSLSRQLEQNPILFYLLMQEAQQAGAAMQDAEVERFLRTPVRFVVDGKPEDMDRVNPAIKDALRADLHRTLSIVQYFRRMEGAIKISRPLVDDTVARESQQVKARVAAFKAADYEAQVAAPTDDELRRHFAAYATLSPVVTTDNPFGFGYKVPDRIAVQWLSVPDAEVAKQVEASKSPELWDEDAIIYYQRNTSEFSSVVPPATQPTTKPFAQVRADVLKKMQAPLIEQQKRAVANRVVQQLATLHTNVTKRPTTGPLNWMETPEYTFEALKSVADAVQKQTGVRPTAVAPAGLLSREDLEKQPGFGRTDASERASVSRSGPDQLFNTLRPLNKADAANLIDIGQPSPVFTGDDGLYVARVVAVEPAHAPKSMEDVKPQVEKDLRRVRAFDLAAVAAQAALDKAKTAGGLDKTGLPIQTSDFFSAGTPTPGGLTGEYVAGIAGPAFETLRGLKSTADLPARTLAKLYRDGVAAVVEVIDAKTTLNTAIEAQARSGAEQELAARTVPPGITEQWFSFEAVSRRVGYVPDAPRAEDNSTPNKPATPANPLLPG